MKTHRLRPVWIAVVLYHFYAIAITVFKIDVDCS